MNRSQGVLIILWAMALGSGVTGNVSAQPNTEYICMERSFQVLQGSDEVFSVYLGARPDFQLGGFDILLQFDTQVLSFQNVEAGNLVRWCGWEYFTYRHGSQGICGAAACPQGVLRAVAVAETNNGSDHPGCFSYSGEVSLFDITFTATLDRTYECTYWPIQFVWYDCGDNTAWSVTGDTLFISRYVYDFPRDDTAAVRIDNPFGQLPANSGAPLECLYEIDQARPVRQIDFINGSIHFKCDDVLDDRGDLNLDGKARTIADAVLYANYFVYGMGVFTINEPGQTAASDVNADGIPLSIADLVYLIRMVVGDAQSPPPLTAVRANLWNGHGRLSVDERMGAAYVVVEGQAEPRLLASSVSMQYYYDPVENVTRVLIYGLENGAAFEGEFLDVRGEVRSIEMATYEGAPVRLTTTPVPRSFILHQNYPNPFNIETTISFSLARKAEATVEVYNTAGQLVFRRVLQCPGGICEVNWDGRTLNGDVAGSGVYYYRVSTAKYSDSRKMVLLK